MGYLVNLTKHSAERATAAEEREIRTLLAELLPGADHPDYPEALALALANPGPHLEAFRNSIPPDRARP